MLGKKSRLQKIREKAEKLKKKGEQLKQQIMIADVALKSIPHIREGILLGLVSYAGASSAKKLNPVATIQEQLIGAGIGILGYKLAMVEGGTTGAPSQIAGLAILSSIGLVSVLPQSVIEQMQYVAGVKKLPDLTPEQREGLSDEQVTAYNTAKSFINAPVTQRPLEIFNFAASVGTWFLGGIPKAFR